MAFERHGRFERDGDSSLRSRMTPQEQRQEQKEQAQEARVYFQRAQEQGLNNCEIYGLLASTFAMEANTESPENFVTMIKYVNLGILSGDQKCMDILEQMIMETAELDLCANNSTAFYLYLTKLTPSNDLIQQKIRKLTPFIDLENVDMLRGYRAMIKFEKYCIYLDTFEFTLCNEVKKTNDDIDSVTDQLKTSCTIQDPKEEQPTPPENKSPD